MAETQTNARGGYLPPDPQSPPPLYAWPPQPLTALRWLFMDLLLPWGALFIVLAVVAWFYLTPGMERMATLEPGWMALIWLRNAALLTLVAGGLHWWLYIRRHQDQRFKFDARWLATASKKFTFNDQVHDNMFWSLASGVTIWSLYESVTLWLYASGRVMMVEWSQAPIYLAAMTLLVFFWGTFHFYLNHRLLHWPPLYHVAHALHHRNVNIGPWTGISMHPVEHLLYFSVFVLWWVVPVHPVVIILTGFYQGISPAVSHSGFARVEFAGRDRVVAGDYFHQLHHMHFEVNYGNKLSPMDKLAGTWHDGTAAAQEALRHRRRERQVG